MAKPLVADFPLPPNMANARVHHMKKYRAKLAYWQLCTVWAQNQGIRPPIDPPEGMSTLYFTLYLGNVMDVGNAYNRIKWLEDWFVKEGYLTDDRPAYLVPVLQNQVIDRKNPRVYVILTDAPTEVVK